jgi:excisionase family DNA binding protein
MKLLTTEEVAEYLRVTPAMVRSLIRNKKLKAIKIGPEYRITDEDLDLFINENRT